MVSVGHRQPDGPTLLDKMSIIGWSSRLSSTSLRGGPPKNHDIKDLRATLRALRTSCCSTSSRGARLAWMSTTFSCCSRLQACHRAFAQRPSAHSTWPWHAPWSIICTTTGWVRTRASVCRRRLPTRGMHGWIIFARWLRGPIAAWGTWSTWIKLLCYFWWMQKNTWVDWLQNDSH